MEEWRKRSGRAGVWVAVVVLLSVLQWSTTAKGQGLFDSDDVLELRVRAPRETLQREAKDRPVVEGAIGLEDGNLVPVTMTTYGESSFDICTIPLINMTIDPRDSRNTLFEGQETLWLVDKCRDAGGYERFVLLEYMAYRSYGLIAEHALRVRLASLRVRDIDEPTNERSALGFFVEDLDLAASRHGMEWLDIPAPRFEDLDPSQGALWSLFQFMIGNTDWSAVMATEGQRCCHNMALFRASGDPYITVVPFDFDQAGLVNAPYAETDERLGLRRVTQRLYRGFCIHNDQVPGAVEIFNEKRPELETLFQRDDLPFPKARKRAWKYIEGFYRIINDPKKLEKQVIGECRE